MEKGSADDFISIDSVVSLGDLDLEILDASGNVVVYSRTAENTDTVSLKGLAAGDYYIKVYGYNSAVNNYTLTSHFSNSALIPSDAYEGNEPISVRQNQTISGLTIAKPVKEDETRADVFAITLDYDAWSRSKVILTDFRSDWEEGMAWKLTTDAGGKNLLSQGISAEISLAGLKQGTYYLTVDTPVENEYSEYSLVAQHLPDSDIQVNNNWSIFIYIAGDNNLEGAFLTELLYMQKAVLPEGVEVYVLLDRNEGYSTVERDWSDTRVGKIVHSPGNAVAVQWLYFDGANTGTYASSFNLSSRQEWDTGNINTLEAFLDWGMKVGAADNYALILKDHGTSLGYNSFDETSGSMLTITEIADLLGQEKYKSISVLAFDQCLMGSDVVVTALEKAVTYTVASEAIGWTPNQLMMYKVLFNSLESEMTPLALAEKIVASCNCSGLLDLTLAAFDTSGTYLSTALNNFAGEAQNFTYGDWVQICKSFGNAYNYGDEICAYSDIISILNSLSSSSASVALVGAAAELTAALTEYVIVNTQITPATYGNGLAIFNPVLSSDQMNQYYYESGYFLDYYQTAIGQMAWGDFLYTVGALAGDVSEYITDMSGRLTFTDYRYFFCDDAEQIQVNLGGFSGDGMTLNGMFIGENAYFGIELLKAGIEGDAIVVVADNPNAEITITLIQTDYEEESTIRRTSTNGVLSLAGVDPWKAGVHSSYDIVISSNVATSYSLSFVANWVSGVDYFDYVRTGSVSTEAKGNNSIDKCTKLAAGNYGGLMTYAGDADYYQISSVYADVLEVKVSGSGLTVQEFNAAGALIQTATCVAGKYALNITSGNYLYIEGDANIKQGKYNSYELSISDAAQTYLASVLAEVPDKPTVNFEFTEGGRTSTLTAATGAGSSIFYSTNLIDWTSYNTPLTISQSGTYYFKAVDRQTNLESKYVSYTVDNLAPVATNLLSNGYSQIVAWDSAGGKVGYVATNGESAPAWCGIWEWGGSEAAMWKVVGVGSFSADVAHDGILLYNGYGNTFAAWTDLGRGDYGYVSLCHVDGNFQTLGLADFDNNGLDDVIIYDENGSFGIVSDARTYHDVWHVDNPTTNVQKVIGAGYFGNADGKSDILVKKTDENAYFLWHNQDSTFTTWNWSQTYIGTLDNDWTVAAIGDFLGDGIDDIIMWQKSTGFMYAWEDGKSSNQRWVGKLDASQWEVAAVGDYNGDGKEDLLLRELVSGWGGVGYWGAGSADNWMDLNARVETDMESKFAIIA